MLIVWELLGVGKAPLSEYASISKDIIVGSVQKSLWLVTARGKCLRVAAVNLTGMWYSLWTVVCLWVASGPSMQMRSNGLSPKTNFSWSSSVWCESKISIALALYAFCTLSNSLFMGT